MSREWSRETWVAKVVANGSRERRVANVGREWESRNGVENRKIGGVCNWDPKGSNYLIIKCVRKINSVENIGPGWLGPCFNGSIP